jgi:hypothetical protein
MNNYRRRGIAGTALTWSFWLLAQGLHGQADSIWRTEPSPPTPHQYQLSIQGSALFDANTVRNSLLLDLRSGGFIDRSVRESSQQALEDNNRAGQELRASVRALLPEGTFGPNGWRPMVQCAHHDVLGLRFVKDLYALAFFGNAAFEERTAQLAPSAFVQQKYQTMGFGFWHTATGSYLRVDAVKGQSLAGTALSRADVYTQANGRAIEATVQGEFFASDTAANGNDLLTTSGGGVAISAAFHRRLRLLNHPALFSASVEDLGAVHWNDRSVYLGKDTTVRYEGIRVEDILDLDGTLEGGAQLRDTFGLDTPLESFWLPLPFRVEMALAWRQSAQWQFTLRASQIYLPGYVPRLRAQCLRSFGRAWQGGAEAGYGGFGTLRFGLLANASIRERLGIGVQAPNVLGWLNEQASGQGLAAGVSYTW